MLFSEQTKQAISAGRCVCKFFLLHKMSATRRWKNPAGSHLACSLHSLAGMHCAESLHLGQARVELESRSANLSIFLSLVQTWMQIWNLYSIFIQTKFIAVEPSEIYFRTWENSSILWVCVFWRFIALTFSLASSSTSLKAIWNLVHNFVNSKHAARHRAMMTMMHHESFSSFVMI